MKDKAFTILEILVVISVIAVLIGISVPRFKGLQDAAKITQVASELKTLQAAVESYKNNHNGTVPTNLTLLTSATPKIISSTLTDGLWGSGAYGYIPSSNGKFYVIYSRGLDKAQGVTAITDAGAVTFTGDDTFVTNGPH
ncbi:MAG: prepilin-type N-terminal cleavage/methylation domain-containing protein [Candidatus Omnitrophota bacterium]